MARMKFTDLEAWQLATDACVSIYQKTAKFPMEEQFGLSLQMRRASASIGANIAEGFGKWSPRDQARSYEIAKGSTEEIRHFLILSERLGFLKSDPALDQTLAFVCGKIVNLRKSALSRVKK